MLHLLAGLVLSQSSAAVVQRDDYGVPHIKASSWAEAFRAAGYAVAEDRLWQLENSRRLARGRMAEVFGSTFVASDREVLHGGYTDEELRGQVDRLSPRVKQAWDAYAAGINEYIEEAKSAGHLPKGYVEAGFLPDPWSTIDSAAIAVRMGQLFGRGGAGEIRNLAMLGYLKTQAVKDRALDVIDDFAWQNDPRSIPTVRVEDDPLAKAHPSFPNPTREETERQLKLMPETNLFELLPGLRLVSLENSNRVAESRSVLFKTGSYAVVVGPRLSAYGWPLLLSGPQMGFTTPSIVHEMSIEAPDVAVVGLDVPGIPGVLIGHTKDLAWGLTSGVADTDDIFFMKQAGQDGYFWGAEQRLLERITRTIKVKGGEDVRVEQMRTHIGPVVVTSATGHVYFARRSSYAGRELRAFDAFLGIYSAKTPQDVRSVVRNIPLTFNLFFATARGDIGYQYCGAVPIRAPGIDPRFPTPGAPQFDWKGYVPSTEMPYVVNPRSGLIANWNNKPVSWWPNLDTPVWGRIFRNEALLASLHEPTPLNRRPPVGVLGLGVRDLEMAAWNISRMDETTPHFLPLLTSALGRGQLSVAERDAFAYLRGFDGYTVDGSQGATIYRATIAALREELFLKSTGNFISPDLFALAAQPSVMLNALEGKTKYPYLQGRKAEAVVLAAFRKAVDRLGAQRGSDPGGWGMAASGIAVSGQAPIPYANRGSYIQIVEVRPNIRGRNVMPPGIAETGLHSQDQVPLARAWIYKSMGFSKLP